MGVMALTLTAVLVGPEDMEAMWAYKPAMLLSSRELLQIETVAFGARVLFLLISTAPCMPCTWQRTLHVSPWTIVVGVAGIGAPALGR